jgi:hypothetical protein
MIELPPIQQRVRDNHPGTHWPTALVILAAAAFAAVVVVCANAPWASPDTFSISYAMGQLFCVYVGAVVVGGIVYALTRKRSPWPGAITAAVVMFVLALPVSLNTLLARRGPSPTTWRKLDAINNRMIKEIHEGAESGTTVDVEAVLARYTPEMEALGSGLSGDGSISFQIGMGFARDMAVITNSYLRSLEPFKKAGGMSASTLPDKAAVTKRRKALQPAISYHAATFASLEKIPEDIRSRAAKLGASPAKSEKMCQAMLGGMNYARLLKVHRLERDMLAVMDEHLADLEKRDWHVKDGKFIFEGISEKSLAAFNARVQKLQSLAQEQTAVQNEWIAGQASNLAP